MAKSNKNRIAVCEQCSKKFNVDLYKTKLCSFACIQSWFEEQFAAGKLNKDVIVWKDEYINQPTHPMLLVNMVLNPNLTGETKLKLMQHENEHVARFMRHIVEESVIREREQGSSSIDK